MDKRSKFAWGAMLACATVAGGCSSQRAQTAAAPAVNQTAMGYPAQEPSAWAKTVSSVKSVVKSDKKDPTVSDPLSLNHKTEVNSPHLLVSLAAMHERSGNMEAAEAQYQRALEHDPKNLEALLAYARLEDRQGRFTEASNLYALACKHHPESSTAYNDLGLCLARQNEYDKSLATLLRAVEMQPTNALYRNNTATVLVRMGRSNEAWQHLSHVHRPAAAHYNLAVLLTQQGDNQQAQFHAQKALEAEANFTPAQMLVQSLAPRYGGATPQTAPSTTGPRYGNQPQTQSIPRPDAQSQYGYPQQQYPQQQGGLTVSPDVVYGNGTQGNVYTARQTGTRYQ